MAKTDKLINEPATVTLPPLLSTNFQLSSRQCLIFTQHHITVWAGDDHNYALWAWRTHSSQDFSWILTHSFSPAPSQISTIFLVDSSQIFSLKYFAQCPASPVPGTGLESQTQYRGVPCCPLLHSNLLTHLTLWQMIRSATKWFYTTNTFNYYIIYQ